jgi:AcrR family transcriptional regulator
MVYHYFGSKDALFEAARAEDYERIERQFPIPRAKSVVGAGPEVTHLAILLGRLDQSEAHESALRERLERQVQRPRVIRAHAMEREIPGTVIQSSDRKTFPSARAICSKGCRATRFPTACGRA